MNEPNPRNLETLAKNLEIQVTHSRQTLERLGRQFETISRTLGIEPILQEMRTAFLKFGGGSLNELLKDTLPLSLKGFDHFQQVTDPEFLRTDQGLKKRLVILETFLKQTREALDRFKDLSLFIPRSHFETLLEKAQQEVAQLMPQEARLQQMDGVFAALHKASRVLKAKLQDYAMLRQAVKIEFWKAEGRKVLIEICDPNVEGSDSSGVIEKLISDGSHIIEELKNRFPDLDTRDPLHLVDMLTRQIDALEKSKLLALSRQALGLVEGISSLGGGSPDPQAIQDSLFGLGQAGMADPTAILHSTFERFREEEIRLAAEDRVVSKTLRALDEDSPPEEEAPPPSNPTLPKKN